MADETRQSRDAAYGWAFSLRPGSWGVWIGRGPDPFIWRFNLGPLHIVKVREA